MPFDRYGDARRKSQRLGKGSMAIGPHPPAFMEATFLGPARLLFCLIPSAGPRPFGYCFSGSFLAGCRSNTRTG